MSQQGGFFQVQLDRLTSVAGGLAEVNESLAAAFGDTDGMKAIAAGNAGFASASAAVACAADWVDDVRRLRHRVAAAGGYITASVSTYLQADASAHELLSKLEPATVA